jgi:hypothetical protein
LPQEWEKTIAMKRTNAPVNPMATEGRETVMAVLRRDRAQLARLISEPSNWTREMNFTNRLRPPDVPLRWQVSDLVGHMTETVDAYTETWLAIRRGGTRADRVPGGSLTEPAALANLSRDLAIKRFASSCATLDGLLAALTPEEWTGLLIPHPDPYNRDGVAVVASPVPAGYYAGFQIIDCAVHIYDIEYGLGNKLATIDKATAGLILPFALTFWKSSVDPKTASGLDASYGIAVDGPWGGRWRARIRNGVWTTEVENGEFAGCDALFRYPSAADLVLTFFGRYPGGSASGDLYVIAKVRDLFLPF